MAMLPYKFINKITSLTATILFLNCFTDVTADPYIHKTVLKHLFFSLGLRSIQLSVPIMSTSSYMAENSGIGKADWTSSKSSDVNQPSVQDRKADSLKLHFS